MGQLIIKIQTRQLTDEELNALFMGNALIEESPLGLLLREKGVMAYSLTAL